MTHRTTHALGLASLAALAMLAAGCGISGDTLVKYERGDTGDVFVPAPGDGTVRLYSGSDFIAGSSVPVDAGDSVGFRDDRSGDAGSVFAVIGDEFERRIEQGAVFDRTYYLNFFEADD